MAKRTRIRALEGRVVEEARIWHGDNGPSLELRFVGGMYFSFDTDVVAVLKAKTCLAVNHPKDGLQNERRRSFASKIETEDADD